MTEILLAMIEVMIFDWGFNKHDAAPIIQVSQIAFLW
jgi:hypothetical protein